MSEMHRSSGLLAAVSGTQPERLGVNRATDIVQQMPALRFASYTPAFTTSASSNRCSARRDRWA